MKKSKHIGTADAGNKCPACLEVKTTFKNTAGAGSSYSRYVATYICSDCGTKEAFNGFFWHGYCKASLLTTAARRRGQTVAELIKS